MDKGIKQWGNLAITFDKGEFWSFKTKLFLLFIMFVSMLEKLLDWFIVKDMSRMSNFTKCFYNIQKVPRIS